MGSPQARVFDVYNTTVLHTTYSNDTIICQDSCIGTIEIRYYVVNKQTNETITNLQFASICERDISVHQGMALFLLACNYILYLIGMPILIMRLVSTYKYHKTSNNIDLEYKVYMKQNSCC